MERPKQYDKEIIAAVVKKLAPEVLGWDKGKDLAGVEESLTKVLNRNIGWEAFDLAKEFEEEHCCVGDARLVDVMEAADRLGYRELKARIKEWVIENDIKPEFKVGDMVSFTRHFKTMEGKINDIKKDTGEYIVNYNKASGYTSYGGAVLGYEDVKAL